eukprot:6788521-Prymnesium_polylepis.1
MFVLEGRGCDERKAVQFESGREWRARERAWFTRPLLGREERDARARLHRRESRVLRCLLGGHRRAPRCLLLRGLDRHRVRLRRRRRGGRGRRRRGGHVRRRSRRDGGRRHGSLVLSEVLSRRLGRGRHRGDGGRRRRHVRRGDRRRTLALCEVLGEGLGLVDRLLLALGVVQVVNRRRGIARRLLQQLEARVGQSAAAAAAADAVAKSAQ